LAARILQFSVLLAIAVLIPQSAEAYIDPGTGSAVTAAILGFFAAVAYTFRKFVYRLKDWVTGKKPSDPKGKAIGR
jgi:hypothetical protein